VGEVYAYFEIKAMLCITQYVFTLNDVYSSHMAKRSTGVGNNKTSRSDKTKKRIEAKYKMLDARKKKK